MEEWRDIKGYEGYYQVSNYGNARSLDRVIELKTRWGGTIKRLHKGKILKKHAYPNGYEFFSLIKNNILENISVHRTVAIAFIPNPDNLPQVNHKDEDKTNNKVENLEWCDGKYNNTYNNKHLKVGKKLHNRSDMSKQVYQYTIDGKLLNIYPSLAEASRETGVFEPNIINCCKGKYKQAKGYRWSYFPL